MEQALGVAGRRPLRRPAPAALLRRVDREPRPARLHAARARLPRLRGRHRHGARPRRGRWRGLAAEEGRQRDAGRCSAGARSIRSTSASAGSTASHPPRAAALADRAQVGADAALETVRWVAGFDFPDFERDYEFVAAEPSGRVSVQRGPDRLRPRARHRGRRVRRSTSRRCTSSARRPCTPACASAARTWWGRSPATA